MKRQVAAVLLGGVLIGSFLSGSVLTRANSGAPITAFTKISEASTMIEKKSAQVHRSVRTASGRISYTEQGTGPVALFVHGVLLNGYLWRHQLDDLSDIRRCIALDLLAHGDTEIASNRTFPSPQTRRCSTSFSMPCTSIKSISSATTAAAA